jgi:hypothetical protein
MSIEALGWGMKQKVGEPTAKLILIILCDLYNDKYGCAFPSQDYISETANCSVRTIQRHMDVLVEGGFIEIIKRPNHVNKYLITGMKNGSDRLSPTKMDATDCRYGYDDVVTRSLNLPLNTSISKDIEGTNKDIDNQIYQLKFDKVFKVHKEYLILKGFSKTDAGKIVGTMMKRLGQNGLSKDQQVDKVDEIFKSIKASPVADIKTYLFGAVQKKEQKPKELSDKQQSYIQSVIDQVYKKKDMPSYAGTDFHKLRADCEKAMLEGKMQSILDEFDIR